MECATISNDVFREVNWQICEVIDMTQPTVVFVTALPVETKSVLVHLEPRIERTILHHEGFNYPVRKYGMWDIVVVEAGKGNPSAGVETTRALDLFKPKYAFFVGVAGGIKDVGLGDVVIADVVKGYETGKDEKNSRVWNIFTPRRVVFKPRGEVGQSAAPLVHSATQMVNSNQWCGKIKHSDENQNHGRWDWVTKFMLGKNAEHEEKQYPSACVCTIVAGEKVVATLDSNTYQLIKEHYSEAVAIDMEAIGFLKATHANHSVKSIVIRGISDLLHNKSPHNDKRWQRIAAGNATAFAFAMLDELSFPNGSDFESGQFKEISTAISTVSTVSDKKVREQAQSLSEELFQQSKIRLKARDAISKEADQQELVKNSSEAAKEFLSFDADIATFELDMLDCIIWIRHSLDEMGVAMSVKNLKSRFKFTNMQPYELALIHIRDIKIPTKFKEDEGITQVLQLYINILIEKLISD